MPTAKLMMPSPEELGLTTETTAKPTRGGDDEWTQARRQLDKLGASYYRLEKADGGFRFVCTLPYPDNGNRDRHFESVAASEAEAIRLALEQVAEWKKPQN